MDILHHFPTAACGNVEILRVQPANILEQLRRVPQWLVWRIKPNGNKKPRKVPVHPKTGREIDHTNSRNRTGFDGAVEIYLRGKAGGIGFSFTASDPFAGVDLDDCLNPATGEIDPLSDSLLGELNTYSEVSVSGTGVHAIAFGALDPNGPKRRKGIEIYDRNQFLTVTGHRLLHVPPTLEHRESVLRAIQDRLRDQHKPVPPKKRREWVRWPRR